MITERRKQSRLERFTYTWTKTLDAANGDEIVISFRNPLKSQTVYLRRLSMKSVVLNAGGGNHHIIIPAVGILLDQSFGGADRNWGDFLYPITSAPGTNQTNEPQNIVACSHLNDWSGSVLWKEAVAFSFNGFFERNGAADGDVIFSWIYFDLEVIEP